MYGNEQEVGLGIKDSGIAREELFLTSKVSARFGSAQRVAEDSPSRTRTQLWNSFHDPARVESALDKTLEDLNVKFLDLYLMHWPVAFAKGKDGNGKPNIDWDLTDNPIKTWRAMEELVKSGKVSTLVQRRRSGPFRRSFSYLEDVATLRRYRALPRLCAPAFITSP